MEDLIRLRMPSNENRLRMPSKEKKGFLPRKKKRIAVQCVMESILPRNSLRQEIMVVEATGDAEEDPVVATDVLVAMDAPFVWS
jgi:hypothetical protein